jgi:putative peptidoglycan binding protein
LSVNVSLPCLRMGWGGPLVRATQEQLGRHKFLSEGVDGVFGQRTEQAVRASQRGRGIDADEIVGPDIWRALAEARLNLSSPGPLRPPDPRPQHPFIRMGSRGPHIGAIQAHLDLNSTNVYEKAVGEFQGRAGLATDGAFGEDVAQDGAGKCRLSWLESAQDEADWMKKAKLAPCRLRPEMEEKFGLRELVTRKWFVRPVASGFL